MIDLEWILGADGMREVIAKGEWLVRDVKIPIYHVQSEKAGRVVLSAGLTDEHPEIRIEWTF